MQLPLHIPPLDRAELDDCLELSVQAAHVRPAQCAAQRCPLHPAELVQAVMQAHQAVLQPAVFAGLTASWLSAAASWPFLCWHVPELLLPELAATLRPPLLQSARPT